MKLKKLEIPLRLIRNMGVRPDPKKKIPKKDIKRFDFSPYGHPEAAVPYHRCKNSLTGMCLMWPTKIGLVCTGCGGVH